MELPTSLPCKALVLYLLVVSPALGRCEAPELGVLSAATLGSLLWWAKFGSLGKELSRRLSGICLLHTLVGISAF